MAFYLFLGERHGSGVGSRWAFMGLAVKLGVSVSDSMLAFKTVVLTVPSAFPDGTS